MTQIPIFKVVEDRLEKWDIKKESEPLYNYIISQFKLLQEVLTYKTDDVVEVTNYFAEEFSLGVNKLIDSNNFNEFYNKMLNIINSSYFNLDEIINFGKQNLEKAKNFVDSICTN